MNEILEQPPLFNKLIIESISDGLFCIDKDLRVTFINSPALKMFGYTYKDCIGKNIHSLIHYKRANGALYYQNGIYRTPTMMGLFARNSLVMS